MRVSVILPVYNECDSLRRNFPKIYKTLEKLGSFEIIIAEDGSTDCTKEVGSELAKLPNVHLLSRKERVGKGAAIKNAIRYASGNVIGFIDIDLSVPLRYVLEGVEKIEQGHAFVTGSRYIRGSNTKRSRGRLAASIAYNLLIKALFNSKVNDHQCGFKFWSRDFIKKEIDEIKDNRFFFDTELIIRSQWKGIPVYEMPVVWSEKRSSKVALRDVLYLAGAAFDLKRDKK